MENLTNLIIDTDIGSDVDDALALLYAIKSPKLDLKGVTTVFWNTQLRTKIAKKMLSLGRKQTVPVYEGKSNPISTGERIWHSGEEGVGILTQEEIYSTQQRVDSSEGIDYIIRQSSEESKSIIAAIGPLTNLAFVLSKKPELAQSIELYIMGGELSYSELPSPEHNLYCDPLSAQMVFESGIDITLIPFNVTANALFHYEEFSHLKENGELGRSVFRMIEKWVEYRSRYIKESEYICMHDPLTLATITHPEIIKEFKYLTLSIDNEGRTIIHPNGNKVKVILDIDLDKFRDIFLETISY